RVQKRTTWETAETSMRRKTYSTRPGCSSNVQLRNTKGSGTIKSDHYYPPSNAYSRRLHDESAAGAFRSVARTVFRLPCPVSEGVIPKCQHPLPRSATLTPPPSSKRCTPPRT